MNTKDALVLIAGWVADAGTWLLGLGWSSLIVGTLVSAVGHAMTWAGR